MRTTERLDLDSWKSTIIESLSSLGVDCCYLEGNFYLNGKDRGKNVSLGEEYTGGTFRDVATGRPEIVITCYVGDFRRTTFRLLKSGSFNWARIASRLKDLQAHIDYLDARALERSEVNRNKAANKSLIDTLVEAFPNAGADVTSSDHVGLVDIKISMESIPLPVATLLMQAASDAQQLVEEDKAR